MTTSGSKKEERDQFAQVWLQYKPGLYATKGALEEYDWVQRRRAQSRLYLEQLQEQARPGQEVSAEAEGEPDVVAPPAPPAPPEMPGDVWAREENDESGRPETT